MRRLGAAAGLLLVALLATAAPAVIPSLDKLSQAIAKANREDGRATPLLFQVSLRIGDGEPVASGTLASHPTGLARLELESRRGFVERHLLQGSDYQVSRDGELLEEPPPWPLLAPVFLLQTRTGADLIAALESFGITPAVTVLGRAGDRDCYVLGGRPSPADERRGGRRDSVWVDLTSYELVRVDRRDGVRTDFGPLKRFGEVTAPSWIRVEVPGRAAARLDVEDVVHADAPAAAFASEWLTAAPARKSPPPL